MIETVAFGAPAFIGLIVAIVILFQIWNRRRLLIRDRINGTKLLIVDRDLWTVSWLTIVEGTFVLAALTSIIRDHLPAIARQFILWYLVAGSVLVMIAIIHIARARNKIDDAVERELRTTKEKNGDLETS